jgi:hypothetical protein
MKPRSAKAKGRRFTADIAEMIKEEFDLSENDVKAMPTSVHGADLWLSTAALKRFPFAIEAKNVQTLNIWGALRQAVSHALGTKLFPIVIFRRNHSETYCAIHFNDFVEIVKRGLDHKGEFIGMEERFENSVEREGSTETGG